VVSANEGTSNLIVYRNDGPEGFRTDVSLGDEARTPDPRAVIAADLDADGLADIASANHGRVDEVGSYIVFFQDAGRFASPPLSLNGFGLQRSLAAADLDGDGDLDLVTADSSDSLPDRPSNRTAVIGLFAQTAPRIFSLSAKLGDEELGRPAFVSAADWNADGEVDLAAALHGNPPSRFFAISDKIGIFLNGK
jgi:hypothetical protein